MVGMSWSAARARGGARSRTDSKVKAAQRVACESCRTPDPVKPDNKLGILYWGGDGGNGKKDWDITSDWFPQWLDSDEIASTHHYRLDNAQTTLRMLGAEGKTFRDDVPYIDMLSERSSFEFDLKAFHSYNCKVGKKVLNERLVIGSLVETYTGCRPRGTGVRVSTAPGAWKQIVARRAERFKQEAVQEGGLFAAVILEGDSHTLAINQELLDSLQKKRPEIKRLMIIVGGPGGITTNIRHDMQEVLRPFLDFDLMGVSLPGGLLHSYMALAQLFTVHASGLLLPFVETRAVQAPAHAAAKPTVRQPAASTAGHGAKAHTRLQKGPHPSDSCVTQVSNVNGVSTAIANQSATTAPFSPPPGVPQAGSASLRGASLPSPVLGAQTVGVRSNSAQDTSEQSGGDGVPAVRAAAPTPAGALPMHASVDVVSTAILKDFMGETLKHSHNPTPKVTEVEGKGPQKDGADPDQAASTPATYQSDGGVQVAPPPYTKAVIIATAAQKNEWHRLGLIALLGAGILEAPPHIQKAVCTVKRRWPRPRRDLPPELANNS